MLKIKRVTIFIGPYKGFLTDSNFIDPFLGNYSDTRVYLTFLGIRIKKILHYRINANGIFYKGRV